MRLSDNRQNPNYIWSDETFQFYLSRNYLTYQRPGYKDCNFTKEIKVTEMLWAATVMSHSLDEYQEGSRKTIKFEKARAEGKSKFFHLDHSFPDNIFRDLQPAKRFITEIGQPLRKDFDLSNSIRMRETQTSSR